MRTRRLRAAPITPEQRFRGENVLDLHARVLPRHRALLHQWISRGGPMGLCDFQVCSDGKGGNGPDYVLVWVRENADPAYRIAPEGMRWRISDCVRGSHLTHTRTFLEALNAIRPVLPEPVAAAAFSA